MFERKTSDALGRRTEIARSGARMTKSRSDAYSYNARSELTNAVKNATLNEYAYQYDDIGNRLASLDLGTNRIYQANSLNQYASISNATSAAAEFLPQFDLDGNQTLVRTTTGDWTVSYNGENRPVQWSNGATNIVMSFDRMGRRVEYLETASTEESVVNDDITNIVMTVTTNAYHRFVYDGYLCVQRLNAAANNAIDLAFGWDPSEPVATRPLWMQRVSGTYNFFYFHDGNKNVSELVSYQSARGVPAHYEYAPFGAVTAATTNTAFTAFNVAATNPFRFSSEYADDALGLVYYNYRHYVPVTGRWLSRDPLSSILETTALNVYCFVRNRYGFCDYLGLADEKVNRAFVITEDAVVESKDVDVIKPDKTKQRMHGVSLANSAWNLYGLTEAFIILKIKCICLPEQNSTVLRHYLVGTLQLDIRTQYIGEDKNVEIRIGGRRRLITRTSEGVAKTLAHEDFHTEFFKEEYKKLVSAIKKTYSPNGYATSQDCEKVKIEINSLVYKKQVVLDTDKGEANHSSERWKNWIQTNGEALP